MQQLIQSNTKLGFGLMRLPRREDKTIDIHETSAMVDAFLEAGGTYFDTAFIYNGSEEAARAALCSRYPRESYYLATKLHAAGSFCKSEQQARDEINISLERSGAGYFDFYLLHSLETENVEVYDRYGLWDYLRELRQQGLIRHYGFSFHSTPEMLDRLLTDHPDVEFVQMQLNYADWDEPAVQSRACYEVAVRHDKPVIVMEPVKGGLLANPPERVRKVFAALDPEASCASWAIRFAASLPQTAVVLSGMSSMAQMRDNLSYMKDLRPLDAREQAAIVQAREILQSYDRISCTGCRYCTEGCPMEIAIPDVFRVLNRYRMYGDLTAARREYAWRAGKVPASACVGCGQCESVCPQHLPVIRLLEEAAQSLE